MIFANTTAQTKNFSKKSSPYFSTLKYHNIFDYPLRRDEIVHWYTPYKTKAGSLSIQKKDDYYFLSGREDLVIKRKLRQKASLKKLKTAKTVAHMLSVIPTIKMIAVTGSLAMMNADPASDIDFMIITKKGTLWATRVLTLLILAINKISTRRFGEKNQKDKICLNLWLDESALSWPKRNIFTAHEIAQVLPILEKDWTYEEFLRKNRWIKKYWPNAVSFFDSKKSKKTKTRNWEALFKLIEPFSYFTQRLYMRGKITNETISKNKAAFHPINLSKIIKTKLA